MANSREEVLNREAAASETSEPVRVMSFNIRFDNPDYGPDAWPHRKDSVVSMFRLFDKKNRCSFITFNTHFDHRGEEARRRSSKLILEKVEELAGDDPVIVMGDLNAVENQEPYQILAEADRGPVEIELFDGFYHSRHGHHGPSSTWNGFKEIVPGRRIDYIFTDSGFSFIQHGILADVRNGHFPSDHLPVVADIEFVD